MGLLAAIRAWRLERGPFPAFADRCVSNQALLALEAMCARKHQMLSLAESLDAPQDRRASPMPANSMQAWPAVAKMVTHFPGPGSPRVSSSVESSTLSPSRLCPSPPPHSTYDVADEQS